MSVYFKYGKWYVCYRPRGRNGPQTHLACPPGSTEDDARAIDEEFKLILKRQREQNRKTIAPPSGETIKELWPGYEAWARLDRKQSTMVDIEIAGTHLCKVLGNFAVKSLTQWHITLYKTRRLQDPGRGKGSKLSNRTVNKELSWFSGFLHYLKKHDIEVPALEIEMLKHHTPKPVILTPEECIAICDTMPPLYRGFAACLYFLGMRLSEVRRLQKKDVHLEEGVLYVQDTKSGEPKKMELPEIIKNMLKEVPPSEGPYMFESIKGTGPIIAMRDILIKAAKGITDKKVYPHLLRHSISTHLDAAGANTASLMRFLGHSQLNTTQRYLQKLAGTEKNIANRVDEIMSVHTHRGK